MRDEVDPVAPAGLVVRPERPGDAEAVHTVETAAFGRAAEADLVDCLRTSAYWIDGLSLVAVDGRGEVVGHLLLSEADLLSDDDGPATRVLSLAPLAVAPAVQRSGIGSALVRAAIDAAVARSEPLIAVLGHPAYYPRFGFQRASRHGIATEWDVPDDVFMVLPLRDDIAEFRGRLVYPACFDGVA